MHFLDIQSEVVDLLGNGSKGFHRRGSYHKGGVQLFILIYFVALSTLLLQNRYSEGADNIPYGTHK